VNQTGTDICGTAKDTNIQTIVVDCI
jgi:hypothetical protein